MKKTLIKPLLFMFVLSLFPGCGTNLFQAPDSLLETTADGLIILGNRAKREQNYEKALDYYTRASEKDPDLADAWYLQAEMELLNAKPNAIRLPDLISELVSENSTKLPFFPDTSTPNDTLRMVPNPDSPGNNMPYTLYDSLYDRLADLYRPTMKAYESILRIYGDGTPGYKVAKRGQFTREIVRMDFTMLSALRTALVSLDQKPANGLLDKSMGALNAERKLYMLMAGGLKNINSINIDVEEVKKLFDGPSDINGMIENLIASAEISLSAITDTKLELESADIDSAKKAMMNDPQKQMQTIIAKAGFFYYNDYIDNDSCYFSTPRISPVSSKQRMIWIDTNNNNQIDWVDSVNGYNWNLTEILANIRRNTDRVPSSTPLGYDPVTKEYDTAYFGIRFVGADTFYHFKGHHGGEFVAGDWSIDEEQLDDFDNDGDGLKDEDSRITSDTLDQDWDFIKIDISTGVQSAKIAFDSTIMQTKYTSMLLWDDLNGDGKINAPDGTPMNKQYVKDNKAAITAAINSGSGYGEWISGDWGIDEEYYDGIDNDGDGLIDEDGDVHRIHNWTNQQKIDFINTIKSELSVKPENIRARN